jgi:hypothetical protein
VVETGGDQALREQWDDANEAVALEPGVVVSYEGNTYPISKMRQDGVEAIPIAGFELSKDRGGGHEALNMHYVRTYEQTGRQLKVGPITATRKSCAEPKGVMEQETSYLSILQKAAMIEQLPRTMLLSSDSYAPLLMYHAAAAGG